MAGCPSHFFVAGCPSQRLRRAPTQSFLLRVRRGAFALKIPYGFAGRAAAPNFFIDKVGGRGDWGLGPFLRSRDALWLIILRRGTFWDLSRKTRLKPISKKQRLHSGSAVCKGVVSIIF